MMMCKFRALLIPTCALCAFIVGGCTEENEGQDPTAGTEMVAGSAGPMAPTAANGGTATNTPVAGMTAMPGNGGSASPGGTLPETPVAGQPIEPAGGMMATGGMTSPPMGGMAPTPSSDRDRDGIPNESDNCPDEANRGQEDGDEDGIGNACDNCISKSNEDQADSDADGIGDVCDPDLLDPAADEDQDGRANSEDNCPFDANNSQTDTDEDGVGDRCDNCVDTPNADQLDADGNGEGDVCSDRDDDGVLDLDDNCVDASNPDQDDRDDDGVGDACDNCPDDSNNDQADRDNNNIGDACQVDVNDADLDGIGDMEDNCPTTPNVDQEDRDDDGIGDVCDNCFDVANNDQADMDNDGIGDACPDVDQDNDDVADLADNCRGVRNPNQNDQDDDGIGDACDNCPELANNDQSDLDDDGIGDLCDVNNDGEPRRPDSWVILSWGDQRVDFNLHIIRPDGEPYSRNSDCWLGSQEHDWCTPGWRGGDLSEQVRLADSPDGDYTVIVEMLAGSEQLQAAAQVTFKCGEPIEESSFGPFVIGAAPFTSGMWTAFSFNPADCTTNALNQSSVYERYGATCDRCDRRRGDQDCPGTYICDRFDGFCYTSCTRGECPDGYRCREAFGTALCQPNNNRCN